MSLSHYGIEDMNVFAGVACVDVRDLARHRGLDMQRFDNLLMDQKSVALPWEDPVTYALNAAVPIVDGLSDAERESIELLVFCSESAIDFSKSMSSYCHRHLRLSNRCRSFEIKAACYSGVAGLQMALNTVTASSGSKTRALVIASDISRNILEPGGDALSADWSFAEPSGGAGAVAVLLGPNSQICRFDMGANGLHAYEVMDTCRPVPDSEAGDTDLSLLAYLECCEMSFRDYQRRVEDVTYAGTFSHLAFHTPFGGMVKGAHRQMMRRFESAEAAQIELDFQNRVAPGLRFSRRIGNTMGAAMLVSLASIVDEVAPGASRRIGCFSYGSGCCSEFFSVVLCPDANERIRRHRISSHLDNRVQLSVDQYDALLVRNGSVRFGTRNSDLSELRDRFPVLEPSDPVYVLNGIREFHRNYARG
jgi:polyketide biosynthesis 3-hydroxy-3-methylglutaryl-CoA synthase-like enzyme PksG